MFVYIISTLFILLVHVITSILILHKYKEDTRYKKTIYGTYNIIKNKREREK